MERINLPKTVIAYTHNSYEKRKGRWPNNNIIEQLDMGIRALEFDVWDSFGGIAHGMKKTNQHVKNMDEAFQQILEWSDKNPKHFPLILMFELIDNGKLVLTSKENKFEREKRAISIRAKIEVLVEKLSFYLKEEKVISYEESLDSIEQLRGKFLITVFRKFNTPYFKPRGKGYSVSQTISLDESLELSQKTVLGNKYSKMLVDNNVFLMPRYLANENPDNWDFTDPDYNAMLALESFADLENKMLRTLKQDNIHYKSSLINENTYLVSGVRSRSGEKKEVLANVLGADNMADINKDAEIQEILKSGEMIVRKNRLK